MMTTTEYDLALERVISVLTDVQLDYKDKWTFEQWRELLTEVCDHCEAMIEAAYDQQALAQRDGVKTSAPLCSCGHDGRPGPGHQTNCPQYRKHGEKATGEQT